MKHQILASVVPIAVAIGFCRSAGVDPQPPAVPSSVFTALCEQFATEKGFTSDVRTLVLSRTRPIFNTFAVRLAHARASGSPAQAADDDVTDAVLRDRFTPTGIALPFAKDDCNWRLVEGPIDRFVNTRELILELSNPVVYTAVPEKIESRGVFARHSLGGAAGASWYWIALDGERVIQVVPLDVSDD
jgi:hypothetical protein